MSFNVTDNPTRTEGLSQQQVLVVGVVSACVLLLLMVLVIIIFVLVSRRPRQTVRYRSQVSMARSDFWPYTSVQSPLTLSQLYSPDSHHLVFFPPPASQSRVSTLDLKRMCEQEHRRSQGQLGMLAPSALQAMHDLDEQMSGYARSRSMSDGAVLSQLVMQDHMAIFDPVTGMTFLSSQGEHDGLTQVIHDFESTLPSVKAAR